MIAGGGGAGCGIAATGRGATIGNERSDWACGADGTNGCTAVLANGGRVGPDILEDATGRSVAGFAASRRIGEGRASSSSRWAFPTIAFLDTLSRRPISAVESPCDQRSLRFRIVSSSHTICGLLQTVCLLDTVWCGETAGNGIIGWTAKILWTTRDSVASGGLAMASGNRDRDRRRCGVRYPQP
jgi:hypothetical protein